MRALVAGVVLAALCAGVLAAQQAALVIVSPGPDDLVSGPVVVSARVEPSERKPAKVTMYADGRHLCTVENPPFNCAWDAGASHSALIGRPIAPR